MNTAPLTTPPGWYPDPSGERQWRVWNGTVWTEVTRPYGEQRATDIVGELAGTHALRRVSRFGVVGVLGGLGLYVSVLAHWPTGAHPVATWFAVVAVALSLTLFFIGSALYSVAVRELRGSWSLLAFVPLVNLEVVNVELSRRLGLNPIRRVAADAVLLVVFVVSFRHDALVGIAPALVALSQSFWLQAVLDGSPVSHASPGPSAH